MAAEKKQQKEFVSLNDYYDMLRKHKWEWQCDSFDKIAESINNQRRLMAIAFTSPAHMRDYTLASRNAVRHYASNESQISADKARKHFETRMSTGDKAFDDFREMCWNHDYYYEYSDDGRVARRGAEHAALMQTMAKEGGEKYESFLIYYYDTMRKRHNENEARIAAERNARNG